MKRICLNRIRDLREEAGLTRAELAESVGITPASIGQYERGNMAPSIEIARGIAATLQHPIEDVFPSPEPIVLRGEWATRRVWINNKELLPDKSLSILRHSPNGFSWGYGGSGPSQLALAILVELVGKKLALGWYQDFKTAFIARLPEEDFEQAIPVTWLARISGHLIAEPAA